MLLEVFLNQKRINVSNHTEKMGPCDSFIFKVDLPTSKKAWIFSVIHK